MTDRLNRWGCGAALVAVALWQPGQVAAAGQSAGGTAACAANPGAVSVVKIGDYSPDPKVAMPSRLGWSVASEAQGALRPNNSFEATGPGVAAITGFVLGRVFFGPCDYALSGTSSGYRLGDGRTTPLGGEGGDGQSVNVLGERETRSGRPVEVKLKPNGKGADLLVCGAGASCRPLATISRRVVSLRYLKSPDSLSGTLGLVELADGGGGRLLVNVDLDASRYR